MPKNKLLKIILLLPLTALVLSGCTVNFGAGSNVGSGGDTDGGIYKSSNKGVSWQQKVSILTVGGAKRSFATADIVSLVLDPEDNRAIYAGSVANGLLYSYDGGEGWQLAPKSSGVTVTNIAVDPADKCVIYATGTNKVYKSTDCSRTWSTVYFDTNLTVNITSLVIDYSNNKNIFMGTSRGEIIESVDRGLSWRTLNRFDSPVVKIAINPLNAKNMFVGTGSKGVYRSLDAGLTWTSLEKNLKTFDGNNRFRDLVIIKAEKLTIFLTTDYGLLKSTDGGDAWTKIELITPKQQVKINAVIANPFDDKEIYYVTNTTFYRSVDGGKNWTSQALPTTRAGWKLAIDPKNPSILYLAAYKVNKQ